MFMKYNIVNEVKLSYSRKGNHEQVIRNSEDSAKIFREHLEDDIDYRELFLIMLLNNANTVLGICEISKGGITGTIVDKRMIFQAALLSNATQIILAHNHPSGNLSVSSADIQATHDLINSANILDIRVLDHIILTSEAHYSLADDDKM